MKQASNFYTHVCKNIKSERNRIGGNWIVAQAVPKKELRDLIRKILGPELTFVMLELTKETQQKRIEARVGGDENEGAGVTEWISKMYDEFEAYQKDEPNTINISINADMNKEQVVKSILEKI